MKKFYNTILMTLLCILLGGVDAEARSITYDFEKMAEEIGSQNDIMSNKIYDIKYDKNAKFDYNPKDGHPLAWIKGNLYHMASVGSYDLSRFACYKDDSWGWRLNNDGNKNGLVCKGSGYRTFAICNLLSGDELKITCDYGSNDHIKLEGVTFGKAYIDGTEYTNLEKPEIQDKGTPITIKVTANCDVVLAFDNNSNNYCIRKVEIVRPDYGEYTVSHAPNDEFTNTFKFTSTGKIIDENREITDVFGINVTLGNPDVSNYTEVFDLTELNNGEGYAVRIFDEGNNTWLWNEPKDHPHKMEEYYKQGTFYKFEPTVSGTLYVEGVYDLYGGSGVLNLECYEQRDGNWVWVNGTGAGEYPPYMEITGDDRSKWSADLTAGRIYYLYAEISSTYYLKSFTYSTNFHFPKKSVVIRDELKKETNGNDAIVTEEGDIVTYHADRDFTQIDDASSIWQHIDGDIDYVFTPKGNIIIDSAEKDGTSVSWKKGNGIGGAIVVTAISKGDGSKAQYVITIPYETHEWVFDPNPQKDENYETKERLYGNVSSRNEWDLTWKVRNYEVINGKNTPTYVASPVMASTVPVEDDNARFLSNTAGLLITANNNFDEAYGTYGFGINMLLPADKNLFTSPDERDIDKAYTMLAYNLDDDMDNPSDALTIQNGSTLTIPNLKPGQHVRIRWNRHSPGNGESMKAYNVTDLEGNDMNGVTFNIGTGAVNMSRGHQEFIVNKITGDENERVDVKFELTQQGWANIFNIKVGDVGENLETHLKPYIIEGEYTAGDVTPSITIPDRSISHLLETETPDEYAFKREDVYTYLRKADNETGAIVTQLSIDKEKIRSQNDCQTDKYYIQEGSYTGTLNKDNCFIGDRNDSKKIMPLVVKPGAHGSCILVLESRQNIEGAYLLDSIHIKVNVYEYGYNEKKYPYTWAMEHFTKDTGYNTLEEIEYDSKSFGGYWYPGEGANHATFKVGHPENLMALKKRDGEKTGENPSQHNTVTWVYNTTANEANSGITLNDKDGEGLITMKFNSGDALKTSKKEVSGYTDYATASKNGEGCEISPKKDGFVTVGVVVNGGKTFCITEEGNKIVSLPVPEKYYGTYSFKVVANQTYKVYTEGSQIGLYGFSYTYGTEAETFVPEFDGLGFIPEVYWDEDYNNVQLEPKDKGLILSGGKSYRLIVPKVKQNQTVYLAVTDDKEGSISFKEQKSFLDDGKIGVKNENEMPLSRAKDKDGNDIVGYIYKDTYNPNDEKSVDYGYDKGKYEETPIYVYEYTQTAELGDVTFWLKDVTVHKVAVSVDTKTVSNSGYATEAREYPLDFTLARTFLGKEQKAYKVTGVKDEYVTISEVRYIPATTEDFVMNDPERNNGVMITGDYLTEKEKRQETNWPLFTTDIDRATSDMVGNLLVGVVKQDNTKILDQKTDNYYNYMLAGKGYRISYDTEDITDDDTGKATETVEGLGFYLALKKGTDMSAVEGPASYPGGTPKNNSAYLKLVEKLAKYNDFSEDTEEDTEIKQNNMYVNSEGVYQVFFVDANSIVTGIDDVQIEDDELPSTEDCNSATLLKNGVFYTLQGVAVKNPTKGIYIFNGKKVYVK